MTTRQEEDLLWLGSTVYRAIMNSQGVSEIVIGGVWVNGHFDFTRAYIASPDIGNPIRTPTGLETHLSGPGWDRACHEGLNGFRSIKIKAELHGLMLSVSMLEILE